LNLTDVASRVTDDGTDPFIDLGRRQLRQRQRDQFPGQLLNLRVRQDCPFFREDLKRPIEHRAAIGVFLAERGERRRRTRAARAPLCGP
jgi:hypothetical protein